MIGSFITMHARLAVRESAKCLACRRARWIAFTKRLPHRAGAGDFERRFATAECPICR